MIKADEVEYEPVFWDWECGNFSLNADQVLG